VGGAAFVAVAVIALFGGSQEPAAASENNPPTIQSVTVDGKVIPVAGKNILHLPPHPGVVSFVIGGTTNANRQTLRIRHRLEGYDKDWQDGIVFMYVAVRFFGADGRQVSQTAFRAAGESPGWKGEVATSDFTHRRETIIVPAEAASLWAVISSAGPPTTVGLFVVENLVISRLGASRSQPEVLLGPPVSFLDKGSNLEQAPPDWIRDGLNPNMAKIIELGSGHMARAFAIIDEDPNAHAEWRSVREFAKVSPGEHLQLEWNELFTMGEGVARTVSYEKLAAGDYQFRAIETTPLGVPLGTEVSLAIAVPVPYWQSPWSWGLVVTLGVAGAAGCYRYVVWQHMRRELARLESQRLLEHERVRIAQDIHDDLGARVTQISLVSGLAQGDPGLPEKARAEFDIISKMARELVAALYETVWAVNPEHDNLDALGNYVCQMVDNLCEQAQLRRRLRVTELPRDVHVSSQVRHNLCMAVKEAVHNVIKHARATELSVQVDLDGSALAILVKDDGCGFDPVRAGAGHGLANMKHRLEQVGGSLAIESQPGRGTTVCLRCNVRREPGQRAGRPAARADLPSGT
jgi:signal transduction histidine kinase